MLTKYGLNYNYMLGGPQREPVFMEKQFPHIPSSSAMKLQDNSVPFQVFDISLSLRISVMASDVNFLLGWNFFSFDHNNVSL